MTVEDMARIAKRYNTSMSRAMLQAVGEAMRKGTQAKH